MEMVCYLYQFYQEMTMFAFLTVLSGSLYQCCQRQFKIPFFKIQFSMKISFKLFHTVLTGTAEEAPPAEETDAQPVKRAAEEEEVGCNQARIHNLDELILM